MTDDKQTDDTNKPGEEVNTDTPKPVEDVKVDEGVSPLDRAEAANKEKAALLEKESKLQDRKEKLHAEQMVGGKALAGETKPKEAETPEELAERFDKGEVDLLA